MEKRKPGLLRKSLVRNVEVPVSNKNRRKTFQHERSCPMPTVSVTKENINAPADLTRPVLNSALRLQKKISDLQKPSQLELAKAAMTKIDQETAVLAKEKVNFCI